MSLDKEPERYYDWILWKFRQEKNMSNEEQLELNFTSKLGEGITTTDSITRDLTKNERDTMIGYYGNLERRKKWKNN